MEAKTRREIRRYNQGALQWTRLSIVDPMFNDKYRTMSRNSVTINEIHANISLRPQN